MHYRVLLYQKMSAGDEGRRLKGGMKMSDIIRNINGKQPMVVIAERMIDGQLYFQVKAVNPANFAETSPGEFSVLAANTVKY